MANKQDWNVFDPEETTTLAVPKEFSKKLRDEYKGANDMARLINWADQEFGYKDSITNEDLVEKLQELNEKLNDFERKPEDSYNNSISMDDVQTAVENIVTNLSINQRTGELEMR